ncbi:DUF397 domain-containing protein [Streptomyces rectiverticillatus]|uniref:DUF397 domain-containing protein n=1 Tax=Streptomyces rectiverticillatus TaxID=173860 RepID=UPI0015C38180|nr:DUF397 domain-containing protein [Streptomyces rectiverticillatus]QLE73611.1 DUF397 domain-containing protein [Streptomyces rectiverticillatus]
MGDGWQKSTFSGPEQSNDCVEFAAIGDLITLRESDTPATVVRAAPGALRALIRTLKVGAGRG